MRSGDFVFVMIFLLPLHALGDGPADSVPEKVRQVPKPGIEVPEASRKEMEDRLAGLKSAIDRLESTAKDANVLALLPDVQVCSKAVHDALTYHEFFTPRDIESAASLLRLGGERIDALERADTSWAEKPGLLVQGYVSRIDGSVQPYGLVVPSSYSARGKERYRLDIWFHGRGETLSEVNFLQERRTRPGEFTPADTIVLHPYGRFCNANKFAGEVDVLEALAAVRKRYRIDDDRISVRGFSMGGAAAWQFAVHYADQWFAANPGAGFAETPRFLNVFKKESPAPTWYETKLWHLYDCTDCAINLLQCPTLAYSGELDSQKQAADVMAEVLRAEGIELMHVIGPGTRHSFHPEAKREVERRMESLAQTGRQRLPRSVALDTYTLKYNRMNWVTIDALGEHWTKAKVRARIAGDSAVGLRTETVTALTLEIGPGESPFDPSRRVTLSIDGASVEAPRPFSDRSFRASLHRESGGWLLGAPPGHEVRKRHDLQGPIDDAFMDAFVFVRPTGRSSHPRVSAWADAELKRAGERWRRQFRGEARIKKDTEISDADIMSANLVLWGDAESNAVLNRIAERLPIRWSAERIQAGEESFPAKDHALIMIAPNPLNPQRYVILNSGFTYREYDDLNNARQVPKLPDWAVVDLRTPPDSRWPGKVVAADFFDESWALKSRQR
jgi:dienelactone hydrolase